MSENRSIPYSEKLRDPRWQKKRLEILARDGWCCKSCLTTERTLHVHHLFYFKNKDPWDIPSGFLLTLCEDCHGPKSEDEEMSCSECIIQDVGVLLNEFWRAGFDGCNDLLELAEALSKIKRIGGPIDFLSIKQKLWEPKKNG